MGPLHQRVLKAMGTAKTKETENERHQIQQKLNTCGVSPDTHTAQNSIVEGLFTHQVRLPLKAEKMHK